MTVGLVLIVRNEGAVVERCLDSVRGKVDYWTVVDTGSTDDTVERVERAQEGLPGQLLTSTWVDFGTNRTEALRAARGTADWLLLLDADDTLEGDIPELAADANMLTIEGHGGFTHQLPKLIRGDLDWSFEGAVHEHLVSPDWRTTASLASPRVIHHHDGGSRVGRQDFYVDMLEQSVADDPGDSRSVFYLAQTFRELGRWRESIELYRRRLTMGGWDEELFYSRYQLGCLLSAHVSFDLGAQELLRAWQERPHRIEPLVALSNAAADVASKAPVPADVLFVHGSLYSTP